MTFSLKKTLSRLHPRRRSTGSAQLEPTSTPPPRLASLHSFTEIEPALTKPALGDLFSPLLMTLQTASTSTASSPDSRMATLKARVAALEAENGELQARIVALTQEAQMREEELSNFRCDYYMELSEDIVRRREATATQDKLDEKLARCQRFISSIVEVGLHNPVLSEAWRAVKAGQPADDALVDSIKKAASKPGTSWSTIIPGVVGPRTPEHYISAINLTLKTRRDLKKATQVGSFWKKTAKKDPVHKSTVTPSSSELSDLSIRNECQDEEKQSAVDDFLAKLKSEDPPNCTNTDDLSSGLPKPISRVPPEISSVSASKSQSCAPTSAGMPIKLGSSRQNLTGTASKSLSSGSPPTPTRPVLRSIDLNCDGRSPTVPIEAPQKSKHISIRSTTVLQSRDTDTVIGSVLPSEDDVQSKEPVMDTSALTSLRKSPSLPDCGTIAAEKALLSLERICAGSSSGSLISLNATSRLSSHQLQTFGSASNVRAYTAPVGHLLPSTPAQLPVTVTLPLTRSSVQVSSLPVLRHFQLQSSPKPSGPSKKKNYDCGIPVATHDDLKSEAIHTRQAISVEGSSRAPPDDVPSHSNNYFSDMLSPVPISPPSICKPVQSVTRSLAPPRSNVPTLHSLPRHVPALAPLASHVLKCEMAERAHSQQPRRVFGKGKIDHGSAVSKMAADKENRRPQTKSPRKRKGVILVERVQPAAVTTISIKNDGQVTSSSSHSRHQYHNLQTPVVLRPDVKTSAPSTPQANSSRRQSLIPVFTPLSPPRKHTLPQLDASSPPPQTPATGKTVTNHSKRSMPSPFMKKRILAAGAPPDDGRLASNTKRKDTAR